MLSIIFAYAIILRQGSDGAGRDGNPNTFYIFPFRPFLIFLCKTPKTVKNRVFHRSAVENSAKMWKTLQVCFHSRWKTRM